MAWWIKDENGIRHYSDGKPEDMNCCAYQVCSQTDGSRQCREKRNPGCEFCRHHIESARNFLAVQERYRLASLREAADR